MSGIPDDDDDSDDIDMDELLNEELEDEEGEAEEGKKQKLMPTQTIGLLFQINDSHLCVSI